MDEDTPDSPPRKPRREKKPPKKITAERLHNIGLHYLQRFPASTARFRMVLMRRVDKSCRFHTDQDREGCARMVDDLIVKFTEMGLLNDEGYSRGMVNSLRRRGLSGRAIESKLAQRGVPQIMVRAALEEHADGRHNADVEMRAALRLAQRKRIGPFAAAPATEQRDKDRQMAALARAGYSFDTVARILALGRDEAEDLLLGHGE